MTGRAWSRLVICALGGMLGACAVTPPVSVGDQDRVIDRIWLALQRGDAQEVRAALPDLHEGDFAERARGDLVALEQGRAAALVWSLDQGGWLPSRYRASQRAALNDLEQALRAETIGTAGWLELARRSGRETRRRAVAQRLLNEQPGGAEALAVLGESWLAERRLGQVSALLEPGEARSARLRWLDRRLDAAAGRLHAVVTGLTDDVRDGLAVPEGLELLGRLVTAVPDTGWESELVDVLEADRGQGARWRRAREALVGTLAERRGQLDLATRKLEAAQLLAADDLTRHRRLTGRLGRGASGSAAAGGRGDAQDGTRGDAQDDTRGDAQDDAPELRLDRDPLRREGRELQRLRLAREWDLAARQSYGDARQGDVLDLDAFLQALDDAAAPLGTTPLLAALPRRSFGIFGEMLDSSSLATELPAALVLGGKGLGMPPELTFYDVVSRERVPDERAVDDAYDLCLVRSLRVPGQAAAAGARFTGAGLIDVVFLDVDELARTARLDRALRALEPLPPLPARGQAERRALDEPLDQAQLLTVAAVADAGDAYEQRLLQALSIHESQHIADAGRFLERGLFGKLGDLFGAGLLPSNVRAELERRAQLAALQGADDPRIPLADMLAMLPVEGARARSEHARGYEALLAQFVQALDNEAWEGAVPLGQLGLSRDHVLAQQLHLLEPELVRAVAMSLE